MSPLAHSNAPFIYSYFSDNITVPLCNSSNLSRFRDDTHGCPLESAELLETGEGHVHLVRKPKIMTVDEWNRDCARVTQLMEKHVTQFVTPLSMSKEYGSGTAWGSGTYIEGAELTWILTAAHVITNLPSTGRLAHLPTPGAEYNAALGTPEMAPWPIDAAALPVYPDPAFLPAASRIVAKSSIAPSYQAVDEELLFWIGFPGYVLERNDPTIPDTLRTSMFGQLTTPCKPMLTQAFDTDAISASNFDPDKHIAVHYPQAATRAKDGQTVPLPKANGMSGSALWDTKFLACALEGKPWDPNRAQICGVVWAVLDNPEVIFVTKIEHVRSALPRVF